MYMGNFFTLREQFGISRGEFILKNLNFISISMQKSRGIFEAVFYFTFYSLFFEIMRKKLLIITNLHKKKSRKIISIEYFNNFRKKHRMIKLNKSLFKSSFLHT